LPNRTGLSDATAVAVVLGAALTLFYMWRRDLLANMIGHFMVDFMVDFIAHVLPRLIKQGML
jgi:membrane protease YdiL (CAAX protease family)